MRFQRGPFSRRAVLKNPLSIVTSDIHRRLPYLPGAVAWRFQHQAKIFLRLK